MPDTSSTDAVVPIPCLSTSVIVRSWMDRLACGRAAPDLLARLGRVQVLHARAARASTICTAISLATSPAACPPMPSATMNTPRDSLTSTAKLSSLPERIMPDVGPRGVQQPDHYAFRK